MKHTLRLSHAVSTALFLAAPAALAQQAASPPAGDAEEVLVLGSRIPRAQAEGPSPITQIDAATIKADGYASVPDLLRGLSQNSGETQSQQSFSGAQFTPGAQQVDLRGLGPNHTLVLVNGRRIADFPMPFKGASNFTDISNIPLGMIESVQVLSGSASAIYGSDAIAGVINFNLKRKVEDFSVDYRYGDTEDGGGASHRLTFSGGWTSGDFDAVFGAEILDQKPLWAYDRAIQDSTADNPTTDSVIARRTFLRYDPLEDAYVDPGQARCDALSALNGGTTYYGSRPRFGPSNPEGGFFDGRYCGSNESIGYGTIISERRGVNAYGSLHYALSETTELFADIQVGLSKVAIFRDVLQWDYQSPSGPGNDGNFFNLATGSLDSFFRQFTPEEMGGGLRNGMIRNKLTTFSVTPGVTGEFAGGWHYEASLNYSEYRSRASFPQVIAAAANNLFLGPQLGVDDEFGYPIFNADVNRLYTPLTPAEYASITTNSVYRPKSKTAGLSFSVNQQELFSLPAGPVGFAAVVEAGRQSYDLNTDPLALVPTYYGLLDSDGSGSRTHAGTGFEVRAPLLESLTLSTAARYDRYKFAGNTASKFTYNAGLEWRPFEQLLVRSTYGTAFRAPDLHYVYSGPGNTSPSADDYYLCRTQEPDVDIGDCSFSGVGIEAIRSGNRNLKAETAKSFGAGLVWSPMQGLDFTLDYYRIDLNDEVSDLSIDALLRDEADCRIGRNAANDPVDINSPTCVDALARVVRNPADAVVDPLGLVSVAVAPINVSATRTAGVDFGAHYRVETPIGEFSFRGTYSKLRYLTFTQYPGDSPLDKLAADSGFYVPRSKASASVTWHRNAWTATLHGQRLDKIPNWDEDAYISDSYLFNGSVQYDVNAQTEVTLTVKNLFDEGPVRDPTYASYPYYDISWFDSVGREFFINIGYRFGK